MVLQENLKQNFQNFIHFIPVNLGLSYIKIVWYIYKQEKTSTFAKHDGYSNHYHSRSTPHIFHQELLQHHVPKFSF